MSDRWTALLSDYLDDDLAPAERAACEAHLAECAECRGIAADLKRVRRRAATLEDRPPAADLWAGIAARIGSTGATAPATASATASAAAPGVVPIASRRRRHVVFSLPQLAAAGIALAVASAGGATLLLRSGGETPEPVATRPVPTGADTGRTAAPVLDGAPRSLAAGGGGPAESTGVATPEAREAPQAPEAATGRTPAPVRRAPEPRLDLAAAEERPGSLGDFSGMDRRRPLRDPGYRIAAEDLEDVLEVNREQLDPKTVETLERNLAVIDSAIADARRALEADPRNTYLNNYLARTMRRKIDLLRTAATVAAQRS